MHLAKLEGADFEQKWKMTKEVI